jgi:hypothetical protein
LRTRARRSIAAQTISNQETQVRVPAGFTTLTRGGFAARGLLYILIGYLAFAAGRTEDTSGALRFLGHGAGRFLVGAMAAGFLAYAAWRLLDAWFDTQGHGDKPKGIAARLGGVLSGLVYLGLAGYAAKAALGSGGGGGGGQAAENGAATAMTLPGGDALLIAAAAGLLITGFVQLFKAWKLGFMRHLDGRANAQPWICWVGRAGYAARGAVFLVTAWLMYQAWSHHRASEAGGLADALTAMPRTLQAAVAIGLALFGAFSLIEARHRLITTPRL